MFGWCCIVRLVSHFQLENCPKLWQIQNVQNANKMLNFAFQDFCIFLVLNMLIFCLFDFFSAAGGPAFVASSYGSCCRCPPPSPSILRSREVGLPFWRRAAANPEKEGQPRPEKEPQLPPSMGRCCLPAPPSGGAVSPFLLWEGEERGGMLRALPLSLGCWCFLPTPFGCFFSHSFFESGAGSLLFLLAGAVLHPPASFWLVMPSSASLVWSCRSPPFEIELNSVTETKQVKLDQIRVE